MPFDFKQGYSITKQLPKDRNPQQIEDVLSLYDEEVYAVDQALAQLVDGIGVDNTIFVLTSDHGEEFWETQMILSMDIIKECFDTYSFDLFGDKESQLD